LDCKGSEKTEGAGLGYDFITHCIKFILFGQTMMHARNSNFKSTRFVHTHTHIYFIGYNTSIQRDELFHIYFESYQFDKANIAIIHIPEQTHDCLFRGTFCFICI